MRHWQLWAIWSLSLLLFQSFILSQVQVYGYLNPYLYILVLLLAPATWSRMNLLIIGALLGAWMDFQMHSGGMHLMATSLVAYFRPQLLASVLPQMARLHGTCYVGASRLPICRGCSWPLCFWRLPLAHHSIRGDHDDVDVFSGSTHET